MKKAFVFAAAISSFILTTSSCKLSQYSLSEAFSRIMKVELRAQKLLVLNNEPALMDITANDEYDVLIIADPHFGNENHEGNGPRRENDFFKQITTVDPETGKAIADNVQFAICIGDIAEHGLRKESIEYKIQFESRLESIKTLKAPEGIKIYNIVGNHDLYNSGWTQWSELFYPYTSFYKFETPTFSWYFLDSASGTIGGYQMEALNDAMSEDPKKKIVISHIPLYANNFLYFSMQNTQERNKIVNICANNNTQAFIDGHTHYYEVSDLGKFTEFTMPGMLQVYGYAVLHVNEAQGTYSLESKYF